MSASRRLWHALGDASGSRTARAAIVALLMLVLGLAHGHAHAVSPPFIVTAQATFPNVRFQLTDLRVDGGGAAWVAGVVGGYAFPGVDSARVLNAGAGFRFVARMPPHGRAWDWVAVVGAATPTLDPDAGVRFAADGVAGLALDAAGNAYVVAYDADGAGAFPARGGAFTPATSRKFLYRVSGTGQVTRVFGPLDAAIRRVGALAVDAGGAVVLTGSATSGLSTTAGAPYPVSVVAATCIAPYALKIDPAVPRVVYATYLGYAGTAGFPCMPPGSSGVPSENVHPTGFAVAIDASGYAYFAGQAASGTSATGGALDLGTKSSGSYVGNPLVVDPGSHAFVTKLDSTGTRLVFTARVGGSLRDRATDIAIDSSGAVIVAGKSSSTDFPSRVLHSFSRFVRDECQLWTPEFGFLAKLSADGSQLLYSGLLPFDGGELDDCGDRFSTTGFAPSRLAVDDQGRAVVVGPTTQSNRDLDTSAGAVMPDLSNGSMAGGQAMVVVDTGGNVLHVTALPQANVRGVGVDRWQNVTVAGINSITRIAQGSMPVDVSLASTLLCADRPVSVRAKAAGANDAGGIDFIVDASSRISAPLSSGFASATLTLATGMHRLRATYHGSGPFDGVVSSDVLLPVNQPGTCP